MSKSYKFLSSKERLGISDQSKVSGASTIDKDVKLATTLADIFIYGFDSRLGGYIAAADDDVGAADYSDSLSGLS